MTQVKGSERVQQICDQIRKETLEPALQEAQEVISKAKAEEKSILKKATADATAMINEAKSQIKRETEVFETSCQQAFNQVIEHLKEEISSNLLNQAFHSLIASEINKPEQAASLITALASSISKHGQDKNFTAFLSEQIDANKLTNALGQECKDRLSIDPNKTQLPNGISLKIDNDNFRVDITSESVLELVSPYISQRFKTIIFKDKK